MYERLLPSDLLQEAQHVRESFKVILNCPVETVNIIKGIVEGLLPFENDANCNNSIVYLDRLSYEENNKDSIQYQIIRIGKAM